MLLYQHLLTNNGFFISRDVFLWVVQAENAAFARTEVRYSIQAYPNVAIEKRAVFLWYQDFMQGREEVADEDRAGRTFTLTNTNIAESGSVLL